MAELLREVFDWRIALGIGLVLAANLLVWVAIARREQQGRPWVRYEGRRPAPWTAVHVIGIFVLYCAPLLLLLVGNLVVGMFGNPPPPQAPERRANHGQPVDKLDQAGVERADQQEVGREEVDEVGEEGKGEGGGETNRDHPTIDLLRQDGSAWTWLLCIITVVLVAPVTEEVLFRLILQGWLEAAEGRYRRRVGRCWLGAAGAGPVLLVSLLFASMHYRTASEPVDPDLLRQSLLVGSLWNLMVVAYGIGMLRLRTAATAADLGFVREKFFADVVLGLLTFLAVAVPIYLMQQLLEWLAVWLCPDVVPDPIPLFFFAVALGFLYYRTHRLVPAIVLHMTLNGVTLTMAWFLLN